MRKAPTSSSAGSRSRQSLASVSCGLARLHFRGGNTQRDKFCGTRRSAGICAVAPFPRITVTHLILGSLAVHA